MTASRKPEVIPVPSKESERAETHLSKGTEELADATSNPTEVDKSQQSKGSLT